MNAADTLARMRVVADELRPLTESTDELDDTARARYGELAEELTTLEAQHADAVAFETRRAADLARIRNIPTAHLGGREGDDFDRDPMGDPADADPVSRDRDPWNIADVQRATSVEDLHARAVDAAAYTPGSNDRRREALTRMLEQDGDDQMYRLVLATTSPAYKTAFGKLARSGGAAHDLNPDERAAIAYADTVKRAMAIGTDAAGGYLVPTDIEAAVTLSADGTNNPIYNIARRVQTTSKTYRVVTSPNAAWSWDGENTEVSDDTPTFANTDITLYIAQGFVPYSYASANSLQNVTGVVTSVLQGGWNDLVGAALTVGTGSQPQGIVTALTASATASIGADVFAIGDVYAVFEALPARHRRNATWMSSIEALNDVRQFGTADSHALLTRLSESEDGLRILGRPWVENEDMDGSITALANNYYMIVGDFNHYVIAEGLGTITRFIPDVVGTTGRPIGASGIFMMTHFGADSVLDGAFRMLNVT